MVTACESLVISPWCEPCGLVRAETHPFIKSQLCLLSGDYDQRPLPASVHPSWHDRTTAGIDVLPGYTSCFVEREQQNSAGNVLRAGKPSERSSRR